MGNRVKGVVSPRRSVRAALVCALAFGAAGGGSLCAATRAEAADTGEELAAGLQRFDAGRKAYEAGQFEEALIAFKKSLELLPSPNTRLYIGRCYRALGKTAAAYTALRLAGREAQDRQNLSGEKRYAATHDTANQEAADLEPKVPRLTVAVPVGAPAGLSITVDGRELPRAVWGVARETDPGNVVIEAAGPRLYPFKRTVALHEGGQERVDVSLAKVPTATVSLNLKSLPAGLSISIDGLPVDLIHAQSPREVDVGRHEVLVSAPGYASFKWSEVLSNDQTRVVDVSLAPSAFGGGPSGPVTTPKWLFFATAGAAVVAVGVATGIAISAQEQQNQQLALDPYARDPNVKRLRAVAGGVDRRPLRGRRRLRGGRRSARLHDALEGGRAAPDGDVAGAMGGSGLGRDRGAWILLSWARPSSPPRSSSSRAAP